MCDKFYLRNIPSMIYLHFLGDSPGFTAEVQIKPHLERLRSGFLPQPRFANRQMLTFIFAAKNKSNLAEIAVRAIRQPLTTLLP